VYFAAGIGDETRELFGAIRLINVPECSALLVLAGVVVMLAPLRARRSQM
jgi:hypothetical protein